MRFKAFLERLSKILTYKAIKQLEEQDISHKKVEWMKNILTLLNRFIFRIRIFRRFQYSKDIIYTDEYKLNKKGKKLLYQFREEIEESSSFPYDITKIKSEFDNHIIARAAYLRGFIFGYMAA